ncbi:MAG TPA: flavodoxin family protein [Anaerolineae bacterium]|nr:flavodoxin family protein [Anaerolineae bacterium]
MKTLVVYDSLYGNTAKVAAAIAAAIGDALPGEVPVLPVGEAKAGDMESVDLLVIGSPTHGAAATDAVQGLIEKLGPPARESSRVATFDTRLTWRFLKRYGFAADKMADALVEKGWTLVAAPEGFIVKGLKKARLKQGETERAAAWAKKLVDSLAAA